LGQLPEVILEGLTNNAANNTARVYDHKIGLGAGRLDEGGHRHNVWKDHALRRYRPDEAHLRWWDSRIEVRRNDESATILMARVIGDPAAPWSLDGATADTAAVEALLRESANLMATGFPTDSVAFAVDFGDPVAVLEMFDSDEPGAAPALSLLFLTSPDSRDFLVRRADDPLAYRIAAAQAERLLPTRAMLLAEATE